MVIDILCGIFLTDLAFVHDDHSRSQSHGGLLVVRRVDHGDSKLTVDICKLFSHQFLNSRVRLRDGAVQKQNSRTAHQGASEKDTVCINCGEFFRHFFEDFPNIQDSCNLLNSFLDLSRRQLRHPQSKCEVVLHTHSRIEYTVFKKHCDISLFRIRVCHIRSVNHQTSGCDLLESADHPKQR